MIKNTNRVCHADVKSPWQRSASEVQQDMQTDRRLYKFSAKYSVMIVFFSGQIFRSMVVGNF